MTQPIQEPGPSTRTDARLTWGNNQLFRRPAPVSEGGTENPWIAFSSGSTTIPTDTIFPIPFADLAYDPALVTQGDIFDWSITDTGDPGNDRFVLTTIPEGWYAYILVTEWDQVATPGGVEHSLAQQKITWDPGLNSPFGDNQHRYSADWNDTDLATGFFEMYDNQWLRGECNVFIGPAVGGAQTARDWILEAIQRTGIDRGLSGIYFYVEYLRTDDSAGWTFDSV